MAARQAQCLQGIDVKATSHRQTWIGFAMITNAKMGSLTQGTIFSCALAEDYDTCPVHGMIITARCDIANEKVNVYNYIPVVRFEDWLVREGAHAVANRTARSSMGEMRSIIAQLGLAPSILNVRSPEDVAVAIFNDDALPKVRAKSTQFCKHVKRYGIANDFLASGADSEIANKLLSSERTESDRIIKELCANQIAEAHFVPRVYPNEDALGYVVLLREVRHIPRDLAKAVANGLDADGYAALQKLIVKSGDRLSIPADGFSWPTGLMESPFIEHLMQRLTTLFSRIGVADTSDSVLHKLQGHIAAQTQEA